MRVIEGWPQTGAINPDVYLKSRSWPKISIVTPSFNQGQFIEETILSILNQNYPNLEFIIIDGGSTDETLEVIKKYEKRITYWLSEKDNGQANAINKGCKYSTGDIINWINSDDLLLPMTLFHIAANFDYKKEDFLAGNVLNFRNTFEVFQQVKNRCLNLREILSVNNSKHSYHQPGVWFSNKSFKLITEINEDLNYSFDWEFTLRYIYNFPVGKYLDIDLVYFRYHNDSKTVSKYFNFYEETLKCYELFIDITKSDKLIQRQAMKKLISIKWHNQLNCRSKSLETMQAKMKLVAFIVKEVLKNRGKATRFTIGLLKNLIIQMTLKIGP